MCSCILIFLIKATILLCHIRLYCFVYPQAPVNECANEFRRDLDTSASYLFPGSSELRHRPKLSRSALLAQVDFDGGPLPLSASSASVEKSQQTEPDVISELAIQKV